MRVCECVKERAAEEVIGFGLCYSVDTNVEIIKPSKDADAG